MDKFEYKIKADEIKELIAQREYEQAAEIADSIDWRRVKSVMMLCTVSDLYKMCRRYEDSRDLLLLAYDRHPGGRMIIYSLCELSIKMEEYVQAVEYYKEYVEIAPKDTGRYILQYKLYEAQDVSLEERIAVLEELKKKEYREKWAYELAYLYHRVGLETKCVEECDELFLWFGEGRYVIKALELKKLHAPLTADQQYKYDSRFGATPLEEAPEETEVSSDTVVLPQISLPDEKAKEVAENSVLADAPTTRIPVEEIEIQVKTLDVGKYDTINLQEELAAGIQEYFGNSDHAEITRTIVEPMMATAAMTQVFTPEAKEELPKEENVAKEEAEVFFGATEELATAEQIQMPVVEEVAKNDIAGAVMQQMKSAEKSVSQVQPPQEIAKVLSMEGDGQISLVIPEREPVEKQITGQISIDDIILEWERLKKENEAKRKEEVRQHVLQQTGPMFTEFEAAVRDGLLEKLEKEHKEEKKVVNLAKLFEEEKAEEKLTVNDIGEVEELAEIEEVVTETEEAVVEEVKTEAEAIFEEAKAQTEEVLEEVEAEEEETEEALVEIEETEVSEGKEEAPVVKAEENEADNEETLEGLDNVAVKTEDTAEESEEVAEETPSAEVTIDGLNNKEEEQEEVKPAPVAEVKKEVVPEKRKTRNLTREEKELFGSYIQGRSMKDQLVNAIDNISMAAYTGNVIVTGVEGMDTIGLAKNIVREVQMTDHNMTGKIAKISGESLNTRDVKSTLEDLNNGALIIQKASKMHAEAADALYKVLQKEDFGIVIVIEDTKRMMDRFLQKQSKLASCFTARVDVTALSNDALVSFAKKYAREQEYSIDELALLALHTRIEEMQTSDHAVTVKDVKEIMDEAIDNAERKTLGHFFDIILGKRYDDEDMIILKEKDFM